MHHYFNIYATHLHTCSDLSFPFLQPPVINIKLAIIMMYIRWIISITGKNSFFFLMILMDYVFSAVVIFANCKSCRRLFFYPVVNFTVEMRRKSFPTHHRESEREREGRGQGERHRLRQLLERPIAAIHAPYIFWVSISDFVLIFLLSLFFYIYKSI